MRIARSMGLLCAATALVFPQTGWRVQPAGKQSPTDTFPIAAALSRDAKHLFVLNAGKNAPSVWSYDAASGTEKQRLPIPDGWLGLTTTPDGRHVYVGGGAQASVYELAYAEGKLAPARTFPVVPNEKREWQDFVGDVQLTPNGRLLYAAVLYRDYVAVINPQSGRVIERLRTGRRPYRILFHPDGKSYFVTSWAEGALYHHDAETGEIRQRLPLGPHTTDIAISSIAPVAPEGGEPAPWPYAHRLFITAANTNRVYVVGVTEGKELKLIESVNLAMTPRQPAGMTPSSVAVAPGGKRLYVGCSDANAVSVLDISEPRSRTVGLVPTGRYPTAIHALPDSRIAVLNGEGSVSWIASPNEDQLETYTKTVFDNTPYRDNLLDRKVPLPEIDHILYVLRDQASPATQQAARDYVRFPGFRPTGDTAEERFSWATGAIAPAYIRRLAPSLAAGRLRHFDPAPLDRAAIPPAGFLWTNASIAGIPARYYAPDQVSAFTAASLPKLTVLRMKSDDPGQSAASVLAEVAKTPQWPRTAIFAIEGDQAYIFSPETKRPGAVDDAAYDTLSVVRTIELLLGLQPMTQFDAAATPMSTAFRGN